MTITEAPPLARQLVPGGLYDRMVKRIQKDYGHDEATAQAIMNAGIDFIAMCFDHPGQRFVPSELVDQGWHTFILYTRWYEQFCQTYGGSFLHHEPSDDPEAAGNYPTLGQTLAFMDSRGIAYDPALWQSAADCPGSCEGPVCQGCFQCSPPS